MNKTVSVSIAVPCTEKWSSFTPTDTGGFCGSCQKNVIDFTKAADDEIIEFITRKPEHACGRFRAGQLKTYLMGEPVNVKPGFKLMKAGMVSLVLLLVSKPVPAQLRSTPTEQVSNQSVTEQKIKRSSVITVKGTVKSSEDGSTLPAVSVVHTGKATGTYTDSEGNFELTIDIQNGRTLNFSFIGLRTVEIEIQPHNPKLNISMENDFTELGEIVMITGEVSTNHPYTERPNFIKRFWIKIKSLL